jgi:hypothetical protein
MLKESANPAPAAGRGGALDFSVAKWMALFSLICLLLALRFPDPLIRPRPFLYEEGIVFFQDAYNLGFWQSVFTRYGGYCTIVERLVAAACMCLPYRTIPFAYSFVSLLVAGAVFSFFYLPLFRGIVSRDWQRFAVCLCLCAAPGAPILRFDGMHWYFAVLLALICVMEMPRAAPALAAVTAVAAVGVWSAPSALVSIPAFLYRCVRRRVRKAERAAWALILMAAAGYVGNILAGGRNDAAHISLAAIPAEAWHSFAYRVAGVGLIGEKWADRLVSTHGWYAVLPALLVVAALGIAGLIAERRRGGPLYPLLALSWTAIASGPLVVLRPVFSINYFAFHPGYPYWFDDRYFFPSTTILFLCLGILWSRLQGSLRAPLTALGACWCCWFYLWGYAFHPWNDWGPKFEPYAKQIESTEREAAADGKIHELMFPVATNSWIVALEVGRHKHGTGAQQATAASKQKLTDLLDLNEDRPGRRHSRWFGYFDDSRYPSIQHELYGQMVCMIPDRGGFWFSSEDLGSFWTAPWIFPRVWVARTSGWTVLQAKPAQPADE